MQLRFGLAIAVVVACAPPAFAQTAPDPIAVDPAHHQVVIDNDHVRVFQAFASPGARSPMHTHKPFVFIGVGRARLRMTGADGNSAIFDIHPSQVIWLDNATHSWEMLSGSLQVIGVEPKAAQRGGAPAGVARRASDPVTVDPTHHHVVMENDHVRVFEVLASPGARSPMHTHAPFVLVSLSRARLRMTLPDGSTAIFDLHPGQPLWLEDASHSWELLSGQLGVIGVEVKAAAR